ncbi:IpaD/SipD/SspD family type III secretion system needle tip protein [Pseudomonas baetica]|uniref:IpaD/SipD/SspD family type III secretion system needle tip protein n=1 Tax=Pseudomonas baetica TaxID=674054 RepID=UPI003EEAB631
MIITNSLPAIKPSADFNPITETPVVAEAPREVQTRSASVRLLENSTRALDRHLEQMFQCPPDMFEARSQLCAQQVGQYGALIAQCLQTLSPEQRQQLFERSLQQMPIPQELAEDFDVGVKSSNDFFDKLLELIDLIKNGYLAGYEHIIAAYSDFFADFNETIMAKMKDWIQGANEGKEVMLNVKELRAALQSLIEKYKDAVLFPAPDKETGEYKGVSKEEAEKWRKALGLPESCLKQNADGTYCVVMDTGPLTIMLESVPESWIGWVSWDTAKFQAWQTGFNAQEERMKNLLQSFTQKYSNANAYHDNFNKTLSAHLNQFSDMLKAMLNF